MNSAILVTNKQKILADEDRKNIQERAFVIYHNFNTYEAYVQKPSANFEYFENVAQQLIDFIQRNYKLKLSTIVIDFVKD